MAAVRCHRTQKPKDEPRGTSGRYLSRAVLQMTPGSILPQPCGGGGEGGDGEEGEVISEAQRQLKELLKKQLDTSDVTVKGVLERKKVFTPAVIYQPLSQEVRGLRSLEQYQRREGDHSRLDQLRHLGLTASEIELKLSEEGNTDGQPATKRHRFEPDPKAQQDRIQALHEKITEKEKHLEEPVVYSGVKSMSRHAMEIERSLFREATGGNPLCHLTVQGNTRNNMAYPTQIMPEADGRRHSKRAVAAKVNKAEVSQPAVGAKTEEEEEGVGGAGVPPPLPVEVIERNRLTLAEILVLPRFRDYTPGKPSKVLFLKNLHPRVSEDDLLAVFGLFRTGVKCPRVRVLVGRMRGQAFVEFDDVKTATKALQLVNGYVMQDKPVIISYGRGNSHIRQHSQTTSPLPPPINLS